MGGGEAEAFTSNPTLIASAATMRAKQPRIFSRPVIHVPSARILGTAHLP
jgi:hypothetical protein